MVYWSRLGCYKDNEVVCVEEDIIVRTKFNKKNYLLTKFNLFIHFISLDIIMCFALCSYFIFPNNNILDFRGLLTICLQDTIKFLENISEAWENKTRFKKTD